MKEMSWQYALHLHPRESLTLYQENLTTMQPLRSTLTGLLVLTVYLAPGIASAQAASDFSSPQALIAAMLANEDKGHTDQYEYLLNERSDRTAGHLWTERVVEIPSGRVLHLLAEDGKPLATDRVQQEHERLHAIAVDPTAFDKAQAQQQNDELHARQMLALLPKAFLFENVRLTNGVWRLDYRPNPDYSPHGIEEHVLHGMRGSLAIDAADLRLVHIEGRLPADVSIGFGLLATIKAGSNFASDREKVGGHWRTVHVVTDVRGHAALFKTVARQSDLTRSEFQYLTTNVTTPQAVALLEK
jgi:hypothetical protein